MATLDALVPAYVRTAQQRPLAEQPARLDAAEAHEFRRILAELLGDPKLSDKTARATAQQLLASYGAYRVTMRRNTWNRALSDVHPAGATVVVDRATLEGWARGGEAVPADPAGAAVMTGAGFLGIETTSATRSTRGQLGGGERIWLPAPEARLLVARGVAVPLEDHH